MRFSKTLLVFALLFLSVGCQTLAKRNNTGVVVARRAQIRRSEVRPTEVRPSEVGLKEVRLYSSIFIPPCVPGFHPLFQLCKVFLVRHGSLLHRQLHSMSSPQAFHRHERCS